MCLSGFFFSSLRLRENALMSRERTLKFVIHDVPMGESEGKESPIGNDIALRATISTCGGRYRGACRDDIRALRGRR